MAKITQLIIGDEILSGKIQDLNLRFMAKYLLDKGHELVYSQIIHDNEEQIKYSIKEALQHSDLVVLTGGLGPTKDDKTKMVLKSFLDVDLVECDKAKVQVEQAYRHIGKTWTPETNDYHLVPKGVEPLENPKGLAPGLMAKYEDSYIFCAPGVPNEFQEMFRSVILPKINIQYGEHDIKTELFNIRTVGVPEEVIFGELCPTLWDDLEKFGKLSSLPQVMGVDLTLTLEKDDKLEEKKKSIRELISKSQIARNVWQYGNLDLKEYVVELANKKNITYAFAESCTGGLSASKVTDISGSSKTFLGSVVSYSNDVKEKILGVKKETMMKHGAVSAQTAFEMAEGTRKVTGADIAISFTGIAGPGGGSEEKPVGTVAIGWSTAKETRSKVYNFKGDRLKLKERFAQKGLFRLLKILNRM
jgi:nicotinamide-nucleotide amidase